MKNAGDLVRDQKPVFDGNKNMYCREQLPIPDGEVKEKNLDKLMHVSKTLKLGVGMGFWKIPSDLCQYTKHRCIYATFLTTYTLASLFVIMAALGIMLPHMVVRVYCPLQ